MMSFLVFVIIIIIIIAIITTIIIINRERIWCEYSRRTEVSEWE
jgi:hypothetical protein